MHQPILPVLTHISSLQASWSLATAAAAVAGKAALARIASGNAASSTAAAGELYSQTGMRMRSCRAVPAQGMKKFTSRFQYRMIMWCC